MKGAPSEIVDMFEPKALRVFLIGFALGSVFDDAKQSGDGFDTLIKDMIETVDDVLSKRIRRRVQKGVTTMNAEQPAKSAADIYKDLQSLRRDIARSLQDPSPELMRDEFLALSRVDKLLDVCASIFPADLIASHGT